MATDRPAAQRYLARAIRNLAETAEEAASPNYRPGSGDAALYRATSELLTMAQAQITAAREALDPDLD